MGAYVYLGARAILTYYFSKETKKKEPKKESSSVRNYMFKVPQSCKTNGLTFLSIYGIVGNYVL